MRRRRTFTEIGALIAAETGKSLYREANEIINESQRLVPVDTGTLKASARVLEPEETSNGLEVRAGYGYGDEYSEKARSDEDTGPGYGVYVHERLDVHHDPPTQAKFLEQPALEHKSTFAGRIVLEIRDAIRARRVA